MKKITEQKISLEKQLLEKMQELRDWANQRDYDQTYYEIDDMVRRQKQLIDRLNHYKRIEEEAA